MAASKKTLKMPVQEVAPTLGSRGKTREGASFPVSPPLAGLPRDYAETLAEIKQRIQQERLRVVLAANSAMVLLYWDIGRMILDRQERAGWGAKVIDRLSSDLREANPEMQGLSPRNLKYMRAFAAAWPERTIVQRVVAQLPWRQNIALLERLDDEKTRLWYAEQTLEHGWRRQTDHRTPAVPLEGQDRCRVRVA